MTAKVRCCPQCSVPMDATYGETHDRQVGFVCHDCDYEEDLKGRILSCQCADCLPADV